MNEIDFIYKLPNGYHLRYALPYDKGQGLTRFKRARINTDVFAKHINSDIKLKKPLVALNTSFDYPVIAADFDELPSTYSSFDDYYTHLLNTYGDKGLVTRSASGKCKVLFQCHKSGGKSTILDAVATLKAILLPEDFNVIDTAAAALNRMFLTHITLEQLQSWTNPVIHTAVTEQPKQKATWDLQELLSTYTWEELKAWEKQNLNGETQYVHSLIVKLLTPAFPRSPEALHNLSVFLVRYYAKLLNNFNIHSEVLGQLIQRKSTQANVYINRLVELGYLEKTGNYCAGRFSNRYKATGELKQFLLLLRKEVDIEVEDIDISRGANSAYMAMTRKLVAKGVERTEVVNILMAKDAERPLTKQRPEQYFNNLVDNWINRNI